MIPLPALKLIPAPCELNVGSGKFVIPCARMHCENLSACWRRAADSGGALPPLGSFERHVCIADRNASELTVTPLTEVDPGVCWICSPWVRSGKLDTPCARMH